MTETSRYSNLLNSSSSLFDRNTVSSQSSSALLNHRVLDSTITPAISSNTSVSADKTTDVVYGALSYWDAVNPLRRNAYMDDYYFTSKQAGQIRFDLASNSFDTYLQIIDFQTGQLIAWDDDSGPGTDSEIVLNFEAGTILIVRVTSYATYATGRYSITAEINDRPNPPSSRLPFSPVAGYGVVDAGAAVASSIGQSPFPEVSNLGGVAWGEDLVNAPEAWARGYTGQNVVVAVIDTGVDYTHPDLENNIWYNSSEIFGNGIDDDRNGYIDDVMGWDFVNGDNSPMDEDNHGTHVAGTIAAANNGFGVTGVAYNARIMPIRVLDQNGQGASDVVALGIRYAANNRANVINLSLGGSYSQAIIDAIQYATQLGSIVIMSAGNDAASQPGYPAAIATQVGIAVGAIDQNLNLGDFSNLAGTDPSMAYVVAPGVNVYSTVPGGRYAAFNGTSMAAPHVSGVAALMLSANPNLTPAQVRQIIIDTADRGNGQLT
ncbi:S8 family peptidase [Alkalinema sp. FACHB-956]|uniref:S8 family peptidase n=1 Tax=Alkalinema sp. FACHB-956 TaxID=2692768 RepID=UPI001682AA00|nr:S8 family peptidase [Alkalinema sp. FACHB-956]MBD2329109.1 S8 family serine peptidase [Alkalinema sp. FACHB-956]